MDPVKNPQGTDDKMPVAGVRKIVGNRAHLRKILEEFGFGKNLANQALGRHWIIEGDVIRNLFQILKRGLGPNQSSHRDSLVFASS